METTTESPNSGETNEEPGARGPIDVLHRPRQGRVLGGVAAGLADRLGVPRWAIRLAFVLLAGGGGAGVLLYLAGWLLIPGEGETETIGLRWAARLSGTQPWVGLILIVVAGTILLSTVPFLDGGLLVPTALLVVGILLYRGDLPGINWKAQAARQTTQSQSDSGGGWPGSAPTAPVTTPRPAVVKSRTPPSPLGQITIGATVVSIGLLAAIDRLSPAIEAGPRHYFALALTVLGLGIAIGTLFGKARWLILFGLLLIPGLVATSVAELADGSWQRLVQPTSFADLASSYEAGAGEMVLDLSRLPWDGETVSVHAELGVGELTVIVPDGVGVQATGDVGIGEVRSDFGSRGGLGVSDTITVEGSGRGNLVAGLELGIGSIRIEGTGDGFLDSGFFDPGPNGQVVPGDLVVDIGSTDTLESTYRTADGDLDLDLSALQLTDDRAVSLVCDFGNITVTLPAVLSYRIKATTDVGTVDLFGDDRFEQGGSVRADSIISGPVLELDIYTSQGDIVLRQGDRS